MRYIPNSLKIREAMIRELGLQNIEQLFESIPAQLQLNRDLHVPEGMMESDQLEYFSQLASRNTGAGTLSFMGAGSNDHFIPLLIDSLISRAEFFTSYTPYQPEASQGTLQAIFEFQSFITHMTGMEVANASVYDGPTALTEAVLMADRIQKNKNKVLVPASLHPLYLDVLKTHCLNLQIEIVTVPCTTSGQIDLAQLQQRCDSSTMAVVVQQPNFYGVLEDLEAVAKIAKGNHSLCISVTTEALSMTLLTPPGKCGFDISVGEAQSFGVPMCFGGPYLGFMATKDELKRNIPGRIVGKTVDLEGRDGFVLTLATREQHIRREKATSNICTNQNLVMLMATVYLTVMGRQGLLTVAKNNLSNLHYFLTELKKLPTYTLAFSGANFNEVTLKCPIPASEILAKAIQENLIPGVDLGRWHTGESHYLLVSVTETKTKAQIDLLLNFLSRVANL